MELASGADCGDREDEWFRDISTAHMNNDKIAEDLLAQTRTPHDAYEYAIRREKGIEHSKTMKINPFGGNHFTPKQEPVNYITHAVEPTILVVSRHKEGEEHEEDRFNEVHIITEDNKEPQTPEIKNSVLNAETSIIKIFCNLVPLRTKSVQNAPNGDILADQHKSTI